MEAGPRVGEMVVLQPEHPDTTTRRRTVRQGEGAKGRVLWIPDDLRDVIGEWVPGCRAACAGEAA